MLKTNNIREDLGLFNQIVDIFLEDEIAHPVSQNIKPEDLPKKLDLSLPESPTFDEDLKTVLKLILSTPKSSSRLFFNQLFGGRHSKGVLGDLLAVMLKQFWQPIKLSAFKLL